MITLFTTAKPFSGPFRAIQMNALRSWTSLGPSVEVLLFGADEGSAEAARTLGIRHIHDVATTSMGTPLLSDMFRLAEERTTNPIMCFANADIILLPDVLGAINVVRSRFERFLLVAQRYDIDVPGLIDFQPGWADALQSFVLREGELKSEIWIDLFAYPRGLYRGMPDLAIGRTGHDNWLIWRAGDAGAAIVDATPSVTLVHQRHDFSHVGSRRAVFEGPEAQQQRELIGTWRHYHTIFHAAWRLVGGEVIPARGWKYRMAPAKRLASHLLRFTRPLRRRLQGEMGTVRRRREQYPVSRTSDESASD